MPSKSCEALKKDPTFEFLAFEYALKNYTLDQPFKNIVLLVSMPYAY